MSGGRGIGGRRRATAALIGCLLVPAFVLAGAGPAFAHGLAGKADLPIPGWLFGWAAAAVLGISFLAFAVLWQQPRLETAAARERFTVPAFVPVLTGAIGVAVWLFLIYAGFKGVQAARTNVVPTFVYVAFWSFLPFVSMLIGNVFAAFNPWLAIGRAGRWVTSKAIGEQLPPPFEYPERLGRWPAVAFLVLFGMIELVATETFSQDPSVLATLMLLYGLVQLAGMSLFGVDTWSERGDAFHFYFGIFGRMAPLCATGRRIATRPPLAGLTEIDWLPGTVLFFCAAIGITAFDGASEGDFWQPIALDIQRFMLDAGLGREDALQFAFLIGFLLAIAIVYVFYRLGVAGMRFSHIEMPASRLAAAFAPSLVPIALAYVIAHYFSFVFFQGQAMWSFLSDPLGDGSDWFGTAGSGIDYRAISANAVWYVQVAVLVIGHAAALAVAHDKALALWGKARSAVRSQLWMLVVMVGFTNLGLWLLSQQG